MMADALWIWFTDSLGRVGCFSDYLVISALEPMKQIAQSLFGVSSFCILVDTSPSSININETTKSSVSSNGDFAETISCGVILEDDVKHVEVSSSTKNKKSSTLTLV